MASVTGLTLTAVGIVFLILGIALLASGSGAGTVLIFLSILSLAFGAVASSSKQYGYVAQRFSGARNRQNANVAGLQSSASGPLTGQAYANAFRNTGAVVKSRNPVRGATVVLVLAIISIIIGSWSIGAIFFFAAIWMFVSPSRSAGAAAPPAFSPMPLQSSAQADEDDGLG